MKLDNSKMMPYGPILQERNRFQATLELIRDSDYANPWCKAQARGALNNLDFDEYPDTGKPPDDELSRMVSSITEENRHGET